MKKIKSRKRNSRGVVFTPNENPAMVVYSGPSRMPTRVTPEVTTRELHALVTITSTAGGVIDGNITSAFGANGVRQLATSFTSYSGTWREYRVLSARIEYHPAYINCNPQSAGPANAILVPFWHIVDRDDNSSSASFGNIQDNSSLRIGALMIPFSRDAKMGSVGESQFVETSADNSNYFALKWFTTGVTASTTFGQIFVRWIVEFKTRV